MKDRKITYPIRISVKKKSGKISTNSKRIIIFFLISALPYHSKRILRRFVCVYGEKNKSNESLKLSLY